jgi:hypothetical protein
MPNAYLQRPSGLLTRETDLLAWQPPLEESVKKQGMQETISALSGMLRKILIRWPKQAITKPWRARPMDTVMNKVAKKVLEKLMIQLPRVSKSIIEPSTAPTIRLSLIRTRISKHYFSTGRNLISQAVDMRLRAWKGC